MEMGKLQQESHRIAKEHGWWDEADINDPNLIPTKIALMHSELSEALEEFRAGRTETYYEQDSLFFSKPEGFGVELADCIIRIFDLAEWLDLSMEDLVDEKMIYNKSRSYRHGGKRV